MNVGLQGADDAAPGVATAFETEAALVLARLERHDVATRVHSGSVGSWSRRIATALGLSDSEVEFIERCAVLHDIGKIFIPASVLNKPGPLDEREWVQMKSHARGGAYILQKVPALAPYAAVVRSHHERCDGRGYPDGLSGDAIPFASRLIAVADSFDAMMSVRTYGRSLSPRAAIDELRRCRGTQFDPAFVDCLTAIVFPRSRFSGNAVSTKTA